GRCRQHRAKVETLPALDPLAKLACKLRPHRAVAAEVHVPDRREGIRGIRRRRGSLATCHAGDRKRTDNQHVAQVAARVAITYELRHTAMWREDSACARRQRNVILPYRSDRRSET